jgi:hypothetical protein
MVGRLPTIAGRYCRGDPCGRPQESIIYAGNREGYPYGRIFFF